MAQDFPRPPFPDQPQPMPGYSDRMDPVPDYGEESYVSGATIAVTGGKPII